MKSNLLKSIVVILLFAQTGLYAQFSVSYFSSSMPKAGFGYDFNDKIGTELRLYTNVVFDNFTPELVFKYNFITSQPFDFYSGAGVVINTINGVFIPIGIQIRPIQSFNQFSIHAEIAPLIDFDGNLLFLGSWGFRYKFKRKIKVISSE